MRRQQYVQRRARIRSLCIFCIIAVLLIRLLIRTDRAMRPNLCALCESETKRYATQVLSNAVGEMLEAQSYCYGDFTQLVYDTDGNVAAVEMFSDQVNRLQSELLCAVQDRLEACRDAKFEIALGTATGVWLFAGHGPHITVCLLPIGNASVQLVSTLESAGVNQTCHTIHADVTTEICATIPFSKVTTTVQFSYYLSETILVGDVPDSYLAFYSDA